ncbi:MAG: transferrin receptor-like dimerization domain-containing protein [Vicinamibacterales bacterium]
MRRSLSRFLFVTAIGACVFAGGTALMRAQGRTLAGFSAASSQTELDWEQKVRALPKSENIKANMLQLAAEPHHLGSPRQKLLSQWLVNTIKSYGLDAQIEQFDVLFSTPVERHVELVSPGSYVSQLKEPVLAEDPTSGQSGQLPTYLAYVADGDVTAPLVYVNNGELEDYEQLDKMGISVKGAIVIARYGGGWRGIKVQLAADHGAVGALIYSDPKDDGYFQGDVYPKGAYRPPQGVQRGSAMIMQYYGGDPETPGWGSTPGSRRLPRSEVQTLQKIPALPISYGDAEPLLKALEGPVAPVAWRGALPITYHVGPGAARVHLAVKSNYQVTPAYDVIIKIPGSTNPDEWIVRANHYDGWVNGASDPVSGASAQLEELRALGELVKQGWRPKRTIIYAFWDGEEQGWLGSTEWAETHATELTVKGVAYLASDGTGKGFLGMQGSHSLERFVNDVARDIIDPVTNTSEFQRLEERARTQAENNAGGRGRAEKDDQDFRLGALGSGSDFTPFIHHLGISTLAMSYGGEGGGGVYHSIYDDPTWYMRFSDGDFTYGRVFAQTFTTTVLRLADADVLPFRFTNLSQTLESYAQDLQALAKRLPKAPAFDFTPLDGALKTLHQAATEYDDALVAASADGSVFRKPAADVSSLNLLLMQSERKMLSETGLPRRSWFEHAFYAPGFYTGYSAKTLPGVREAMEAGNWTEAADQQKVLVNVIANLTTQIRNARNRLR